MIRFPCRCRHVFAVADDMAGQSIQCPQCGLLRDVPELSDLGSLEDDGTIKVEERAVAPEPDRLEALSYIYAKGRVDPDGNEIDLRTTDEDYALAGDDPDDAKPQPFRPRYDPETGELIRPFELKQDPDHVDPASIPFAKPAISYASPGQERIPGSVVIQLLMPINMLVMFFALFIQGSWAFATDALSRTAVLGAIFIWLEPLMQIVLLAHYGNVIDDTGPDGRDELPRLFRDLRWHEDIWSPLVSMLGALFISYAPALVCLQLPAPVGLLLALPALLAGSVIFPAVLLTLQTSGSLPNLRPDRVLRVMRACGIAYFIVIPIWMLAAVCYAWSASGLVVMLLRQWGMTRRIPAALLRPELMLPALMCGIYFMHLFCWKLGILYRRFSPTFEWVHQYHKPTERPTVAAGARGS